MGLPDTPRRRLLRGYGPLLGAAVVLALVATFMPTVGQKVVTRAAAGSADTSEDVIAGTDGSQVASGAGATSTGARGAVVIKSGGPSAGSTGPCSDRRQQIPGDPYSPPCMAFTGSNGGATSRGVTADSVVVSSRVMSDFASILDTINQMSGGKIQETVDDIERDTLAYADYFNSHFQFYGRKIKVQFFNGKGSGLAEILGGGQEEAEADAIKAAEEMHVFADVGAVSTVPYGDALARRKTLTFGTPSASREWMVDHRPFAWSTFSDCSSIVEAQADWVNKRLAHGAARWAGGSLKDRPRTLVEIGPDNPWYLQCTDRLEHNIRSGGTKNFTRGSRYKLDLSSYSNQAADIVAKLKNGNYTTVLCNCDPFFTLFVTSKAKEQGYQPEWITSGAGLVDLDFAGQLLDQNEWSHAFGISQAGAAEPERASLPYNAYKSVRGDEPSFAAPFIYWQMYLLALGIQMAGPNLTPETFEAGMFAYPGGTGPAGTWAFGKGNYTPARDAREIWWDASRKSVVNGLPGAWVDSEPGKRYQPGQWTPGDPQVFK